MTSRRGCGHLVVIALLAAATAGALLYRPDITPRELEARYTDDASRFAEVAGVRMHYRDEGAGDPLLLLHGTGSSLHTWDGWEERLSGSFRILRVDLTGFGLTGPDASRDYSIERRAETLLGLLDQLGVERFSVAGNSLGGLVALQLTLSAPERVDRLILLAPAGHPQQRRGGGTVLDLARLPVAGVVMSRITPRALVARAVREAYGDPTRVPPAVIDRHYELLRREGNREALLAGLDIEVTLDRDDLRSITQPTLLLWGELDRLITVEVSEAFREDLPNAQLIVYPGIGHVPMEEIPDRTSRDAEEFLESR